MAGTLLKKEERKACWSARDQYFLCLDKINIVDALQDNSSQCQAYKSLFLEKCPNSWVEHFSQLRSASARQKAYEQLMNNPEYRTGK